MTKPVFIKMVNIKDELDCIFLSIFCVEFYGSISFAELLEFSSKTKKTPKTIKIHSRL